MLLIYRFISMSNQVLSQEPTPFIPFFFRSPIHNAVCFYMSPHVAFFRQFQSLFVSIGNAPKMCVRRMNNVQLKWKMCHKFFFFIICISHKQHRFYQMVLQHQISKLNIIWANECQLQIPTIFGTLTMNRIKMWLAMLLNHAPRRQWRNSNAHRSEKESD